MKKIGVTRSNIILLVVLVIIYVIMLLVTRQDIFRYRFDPALIKKYLVSQDIPHEVKGRLFLSDSDIHIAAGYLYAHGNDPTDYNFQHPPLVKYLFGGATLLLGNPLYVQIAFGIGLICCTYLLGVTLLRSKALAFVATALFLFDPLLKSLSGEALLDLGQAFFAVLYVLLSLAAPQAVLVGGVVLGFLAGSKFWAAGAFVFLVISIFNLYRKNTTFSKPMLQLIIAVTVFSLLYLPTFIAHHGLFNLIFFELKTVKYWFNHSVTSIPLASLSMFVTGLFRAWWGSHEFTNSTPWSIAWPIGLFMSTMSAITCILRKNTDKIFLISTLPLLYLLYLGIQAPFPRYFIFILPYLYIASTAQVALLLQSALRRISRQNKV